MSSNSSRRTLFNNAAQRQPNMSAVIKSGLKRLEYSLDVTQSMRCLWAISLQRIQKRMEKETNQPRPFSLSLSYPILPLAGSWQPVTDWAGLKKRKILSKVHRM